MVDLRVIHEQGHRPWLHGTNRARLEHDDRLLRRATGIRDRDRGFLAVRLESMDIDDPEATTDDDGHWCMVHRGMDRADTRTTILESLLLRHRGADGTHAGDDHLVDLQCSRECRAMDRRKQKNPRSARCPRPGLGRPNARLGHTMQHPLLGRNQSRGCVHLVLATRAIT